MGEGHSLTAEKAGEVAPVYRCIWSMGRHDGAWMIHYVDDAGQSKVAPCPRPLAMNEEFEVIRGRAVPLVAR